MDNWKYSLCYLNNITYWKVITINYLQVNNTLQTPSFGLLAINTTILTWGLFFQILQSNFFSERKSLQRSNASFEQHQISKIAQIAELVFSQNFGSRFFFCFVYLDQPFMIKKHIFLFFLTVFFTSNLFFVWHLLWHYRHNRKYATFYLGWAQNSYFFTRIFLSRLIKIGKKSMEI